MTKRGSRTSLIGGLPAALAYRCARSRRVVSGGEGTCQARPQARSSRASVTRALAMSRLCVKVCGTSRSPGIQAVRPFSRAGPMTVEYMPTASLPT